MKSINFPKMFNTASTNVLVDHKATESNLRLLLSTEKGEFIGDPEFGISLKKYMYVQNSTVLMDLLADELYTQIALFMPQLVVERRDIKITNQGSKLIARINALNKIDYTTNMYNIVLLSNEGDATE